MLMPLKGDSTVINKAIRLETTHGVYFSSLLLRSITITTTINIKEIKNSIKKATPTPGLPGTVTI